MLILSRIASQRLIRAATCLLAGALLCSTAHAGDFIDTRITFTIGDDNFLKSAGEQVPDSPRFGIGDREGYELSFDNLDLATSGRENQIHLVLYRKVDGIFPGLITEAAASIEIDLGELESSSPRVDRVFSDDSSYIRLAYALDADRKGKEFLDLVVFPLQGDRFRVGYLYDLTWGGTRIFARQKGPTPAFKLGGNHGRFYWWAGMKIVRAQTAPEESKDEQGLTITTEQQESFYGVLAGMGVQPVDGLSIDFSAGHIQVGENPIKDVAGETVTASGFSARLAYGRGLKVGLSSDLRLVRNDPDYLEGLSRRPTYKADSKLSWRISAEGTAVAQVLADRETFGATTAQWASAAAVDFRLQYNYMRFNLTGVYRSLEFILLDTPSFVAFEAFPSEVQVKPNFFGAVAFDYHFPKIGLTPGIQAGIEVPASVTTELTAKEVGSNAPPTLLGKHTIVVRGNGRRVILPQDAEAVPLFQFRGTARWYASQMLTLVAFAFVTIDENAEILVVNPDLTRTRVFDDSVRFGAGLQMQARF